jgi:Tol biopolymer transport system component
LDTLYLLKNINKALLITALFAPWQHLAWGQGMYTPFGQNRVQHTRFDWQFVRAENFDAYFYSGGRELAQFAARTAETRLGDIERIVDHRLSGRVEIICYNTQADLKQGNFGLSDQPINSGGVSKVNANKIFVYFNGNRQHFEQQIISGLALVLINELLFGGNIQERVQNATLLSLPDWYIDGLTGSIASKWNLEHANKLKDLLERKKVKNLNRLVYLDEELAGLSFWNFLIDKYGEEIIPNMVYVTRISRNYESALFYLTGQSMKQVTKDWLKYYQTIFAKEDSLRTLPNDRYKIKKRLQPYLTHHMRVSPKGDNLTLVTNKYGKYKIWNMNTQTGKMKKIHRGGLKYHQMELDVSYPTLAWHPGGEKVSFVHEKKGKVLLTTVDLNTKKKQTTWLVKFDKVVSMSYADNERLIVMSAIRKGQSDIYIYDTKTARERQLTNDAFDDLYPRFVDGSSKIIFSSNRNTDSLSFAPPPTITPENNFDIYLLDVEQDGPRMKRLTYTPYINEIQPLEYNNEYYAYLSDFNGIRNRYASRIRSEYDFTELIIKYTDPEKTPDTLYFDQLPEVTSNQFVYEGRTIEIDSNVLAIDTIIHEKDFVYTYPLTNYKRNVIAQDISRQTQIQYEIFYTDGRMYVYYGPTEKDIVATGKRVETYPTMSRLKTGRATSTYQPGMMLWSDRRFIPQKISPAKDKPKEPKKVEKKYDYFFVSEFTRPDTKAEDIKIASPFVPMAAQSRAFKLNAPRFYDVTFFSDKLVTQIDNSVINTYYQPITATGDNLFNPGLNGMFNVGLVDLLEDYRIVGGFRLAFDLSGIDYFLSYETLKKKLDHKFTFYRQSRSGAIGQFPTRNLSHEIRYQLSIPFNQVWSLRLSPFVRSDRDIFRAINNASLERADIVTNWGGGKAELVFDNTIPKGMNLWNGTRFKIFYEHYRNILQRDVQLNAWGFDFRHYQKIHRQLIFAFRATYNNSFGPAKVKYILGGVDNWLFPQFNSGNVSMGTENFVFQALATNMRGFQQNIRNGNSFAAINNEIRWPVFSYLFNRPIRSEFLRQFQLVPFYDIGTAWIGSNPYSDENTFNQKIVEVAYLKATVINVREPIVMGFGNGFRTKILGYFARFDVAWGVQDFEVAPRPVYHFSLSMDF